MRVTCLLYPPREVGRRGDAPDGEEARHLRPPAACSAAGGRKRSGEEDDGVGAGVTSTQSLAGGPHRMLEEA